MSPPTSRAKPFICEICHGEIDPLKKKPLPKCWVCKKHICEKCAQYGVLCPDDFARLSPDGQDLLQQFYDETQYNRQKFKKYTKLTCIAISVCIISAILTLTISDYVVAEFFLILFFLTIFTSFGLFLNLFTMDDGKGRIKQSIRRKIIGMLNRASGRSEEPEVKK